MNVERLLVRAPVYDLVFAHLSPRELIRIARTCRAAYEAVASFKNRAFNINRHFSRYFTDPLAFRSLQARTNTLVSGSNALQFLDRSFYPGSDLDLYTHPGHSREVAQFLIEAEDYHFVPRREQEPDWTKEILDDWDGTQTRVRRITAFGDNHAYPNTEIDAVWTFAKTSPTGEALKIQIIAAESSALEVILGFHCTCVMNVISADTAYALYPMATFEARSGLGMPSALRSPNAIEKYIQRGWRIYYVPVPSGMAQTNSQFMPNVARWVGDRHTWVLPLDCTGVHARPPLSPASAPLTFDPVRCNGWTVVVAKRGLINGYEVQYCPVRTTVFRYNYTIPDAKVALEIREWATWHGRMCHFRVSKENWVWYDADVPAFLRREI